ncbi:MAG: folate-binding protein [Hyphomicrobiales bacterium]|uniref:CAF17-like 4Fe-4S cluster assembly/insertion protein YgfZ n=1 Tax=Nisaea sp. TaxID=2024842 RepID=UPI00327112FA
MSIAAIQLENRALIHITGVDAETLLQGLITFDMDILKTKDSGFGALLTPQGKVLFDFFIVPMDDGFLFDTLADAAPDFLKRMSMYKLRSDMQLKDVSEELSVVALLPSASEEELPTLPGTIVADPRHIGLGHRAYVSDAVISAASAGEDIVMDEPLSYLAKRVSLGVPEAPLDYAYGDVFPHDINLDQMQGVAFNKGCFVGQEVVSRVKHRGTARKRIVLVSSEDLMPEPGTDIQSEKKSIGTLGSVSDQNGLAMVRLDKVNDALEEGHFINAGSVRLTPAVPDWVTFSWV